jgi:hypothetical protein
VEGLSQWKAWDGMGERFVEGDLVDRTLWVDYTWWRLLLVSDAKEFEKWKLCRRRDLHVSWLGMIPQGKTKHACMYIVLGYLKWTNANQVVRGFPQEF